MFPLKLLELIELCLSTAHLSQPTSSPSSEQPSLYTAKLDIKSGVFSIIESNKFKQITHICLPLSLGDDNAIKMYLASRLSLVLDISKRQTREINTLQHQLESQIDTNQTLNHELKELRYIVTIQLNLLKIFILNFISCCVGRRRKLRCNRYKRIICQSIIYYKKLC
jgi:hypothetical protein